MCNETVKCIDWDIVDTKGLWGLEKQLEKFLGGGKKHWWLPAGFPGTAQSYSSLQAERLLWGSAAVSLLWLYTPSRGLLVVLS